MYRYDGEPIPKITKDMTPTTVEGIRNAEKLKAYLEEGLETDTLPLNNKALHRRDIAEQVGFGRSAYQQNPYIKNLIEWAESQNGQKPKPASTGRGSTDKEKELSAEVSRLQNRNITLKTELHDAETKLREVGYVKKQKKGGGTVYVRINQGIERLPWEDDVKDELIHQSEVDSGPLFGGKEESE